MKQRVDGRGLEVEGRLMTLKETAAYLNLSQAEVYSLARSGELPAVKIGARGSWRVDRRRLETFLDGLHEATDRWVSANRLDPSVSSSNEATSDELLTAAEAAEVIGVTRQNISYLVRTDQLRAFKRKGRWMIFAADVENYVKRRS